VGIFYFPPIVTGFVFTVAVFKAARKAACMSSNFIGGVGGGGGVVGFCSGFVGVAAVACGAVVVAAVEVAAA
jgi:hypothetical protein